jgi:hypothetical protein
MSAFRKTSSTTPEIVDGTTTLEKVVRWLPLASLGVYRCTELQAHMHMAKKIAPIETVFIAS